MMIETIKEGVRIYTDESGREFYADQYDCLYKPAHNIKMKTDKYFKGENPDKTKAWFKDLKSY